MSVPVAVLDHVSKRFVRRGPWVIDDASLSLQPGSKTAILGGNGSGKSTLLRMIAGIARPTTGVVLGSRTVGYVPERLASQVRMAGAEYLIHMGRIRGMTSVDAARRSTELLDRLELRPSHTTLFGELSKGNRQKVMAAQAFLVPVELLVLDEPFSGLDATSAEVLQSLMHDAQGAGSAVVMSLHTADLGRVDAPALRIEDGHLEAGIVTSGFAGPARGTMTVELDPASARCDTDWIADMPDARIVEPSQAGDPLVVAVRRDRLDHLLVVAIQAGWSVRSVGPTRRDEDPGSLRR